ncbi:MAG TPA: PadR family transcriptional regulator [Jiangellaceae bacterium]
MSIRFGLMALLEQKPMYGYQLRQHFERATGATWPLNIGQVYTTLARLERDELVVPFGPPDDEGRQLYKLTDKGRADLEAWFDTPIEGNDRPRDELAIKIAMAVTSCGPDVATILQKQRTASMRRLQELTRLRAQANVDREMAWLLVLDAMIFRTEAELRWLDHSETRITRMTGSRRGRSDTTAEAARVATAATGDGDAAPETAGANAAQVTL